MGKHIDKSGPRSREHWEGRHRREHWYSDHTVYFLTARVRDGLHLFREEASQSIFWTKFEQYTSEAGFETWVVTLMSNHYHVLGYLDEGANLREMMRKLHGSVAKLVCKQIGHDHVPFWGESQSDNYMDGCLRSMQQLVDTYAYVRDQAVRAGVVTNHRAYTNTRVLVSLEEAQERATERDGLLIGVPYPRYDRRNGRGTGS